MTERHSVRDVKNTFESILGENAKVIRDIDETISKTKSDMEAVDGLYTRALDKFVTSLLRPMDSEALKTLSGLTTGKRDFEQEYHNNMAAARASEIRLNGLVTAHGEEKTLKQKLDALSRESSALGAESLSLASAISRQEKTLRPVDGFNAQAAYTGKPKLDAEGIGYFSSKKGFSHVWSWMFDSHYRGGRALIKSFAEGGETIPAVQQSLADDTAQQEQKKARLEEMSAEANRLQPILKNMREAADGAHSEHTLRERLKKEVMAAFDDMAFFNRAAKKMGAKFPVFVTEQRAKLENLRKIHDGALKTRQTVQQAGGKLDKHMSKLRRAASSSGSTRISIDLNGIKTSFGGMQASVKAQSAQMRQTSSAVRDYKFSAAPSPQVSSAAASAPGGMDPVFFMAVIMMSDISHAPHVPDVSVPDAGSAIGDSFNSAAIDGAVGSVDVNVPDVNVSVPDISVPDISVPDISVPDVSISVSDFGGGGGFDAGGF